LDTREDLRRARDAIDPGRRYELSEAIDGRLDELEPFATAKVIGFFFSVGSEVQAGALVRRVVEEEGRRAFLPFVRNDQLFMTEWRPSDPVVDAEHVGMQPRFSREASLDELDAIVLTGLAFDQEGRRAGEGTGHHDDLLRRLPQGVVRIGVEFDELVVPNLTEGADSERVDFVVTESRIVETGARGQST
jgi:5-formyltetrahydrofolate cyclo-ligase